MAAGQVVIRPVDSIPWGGQSGQNLVHNRPTVSSDTASRVRYIVNSGKTTVACFPFNESLMLFWIIFPVYHVEY